MIDNPRLQQLLDKLFNSQATPDEVCASCPELLPEVRRRWRQIRCVQTELDALFPPSSDDGASSPALPTPDTLPEVPGYQVDRMLGHGGVGVVYRALHLRLHRPVALKMLLAGPHARSTERERFQREVEAVAALRHPNIVQIYDVGDVKDQPYFTMELVEGGSLAEAIQGVPQPASQAAALVALLAEAIHVAHQSGIVHRDLKPGNVLLTSDGTPKVTDFGLAWRLEGCTELTLDGVQLGTPSYMSPCQARGDKAAMGPATDIWAIGAILYELLTGRPPFRSDTASATLHQVVNDEPVLPRRLNPRVPRDLQTICLKCLQKEPDKRYASAQALAEDLRRFERGEPIKARPVRWLGRLVRWARRRPTVAGLVGVLVITIALAFTLVGEWLRRDGRQRATALAAEEDLREADRLLLQLDLPGAFAAAERARGRLGTESPDALRNRLEQTEQAIQQRAEQAKQSRALLTRLEAIRLNRVIIAKGRQNRAQSDRDYAEEFRAAGLAAVGDDPEVVAARLAASPVKQELVAALDDWAVCTDDEERRTWLMNVARKADPDPWRDRVRDPDPTVWKDRVRLAELARTAPLTHESLHLLVALGSRLQDDGGDRDAVTFLRRVQRAHPADFFANYMLACALQETGDAMAAIGHFRAALAVRQDAANAWFGLGSSLLDTGQLDDAEFALTESVRLAPIHGWAHWQLGVVQRKQNKLDQAIDHLRQAVLLSSPAAWMQTELARALQGKQRWEEAIRCYREAARLDPDNAWTHYDLGMALNTPGRQDEAITHLQKAASLEPNSPEIQRNLGLALIARDRPAEAIEHLQAAVAMEPNNTTDQQALRTALIHAGRLEEAREAWKKILDAGPSDHEIWSGYPELCLFLGNTDEFRWARSALLARFRDTSDPFIAERVARAYSFLPASEDELRQVASLAERATAAADPKYDWARPYFHFAKGLSDYRLGRFDDAIAAMSSGAKDTNYIGPSAQLVMAMALYRKGDTNEARNAWTGAVESYDWNPAKADNRDVWIPHILRREAESMILSNQPAVERHP